tara:strand:- start:3228 stop:4088 length:861 start_codon:yes stop_codon:yes gene_type:complete
MSVTQEVKAEDIDLLKPQPYVGRQRQVAIASDNLLERPPSPEEEAAEKETSEEDDAAGEEKTFKKRYGDSRRYIQELKDKHKDELEAARKDAQDAAEAKAALQATRKTPEELAAFKEEHPDAYAILESVAAQTQSSSLDEVKDLKEELRKVNDKLNTEKSETILRRDHPDWDEIKEDEDIHAWLEEQPEEIQDWLYESQNGKMASKVVSLYKAERGITSGKKSTSGKKLKEDASKLVESRGSGGDTTKDKPIFTSSQIDKMSIQEYEERYDEITLALAEGRFDANK